MIYKNLYKLQDGVLIRNTENKIVYTDKNGVKRTKTNPCLADFLGVGIKPIKTSAMPEYDSEKYCLQEKIIEKDDCFLIAYQIKEVKTK